MIETSTMKKNHEMGQGQATLATGVGEELPGEVTFVLRPMIRVGGTNANTEHIS